METKTVDNMHRYFDFGVFGYIPQDKTTVFHLAYTNEGADNGVATIGLKTVKTEIKPITESVKVESGDELFSIADHVIDKAFERLVACADLNREIINGRFPTGIDIKRGSGHRKMLARILVMANMIATTTRRGPATFVLVNESVYKELFFPDGEPKVKFFSPTSDIAGLKFFISPIGDKVIVGRQAKENEPGIFIQCKEPTVENYKINENHDIESMDAVYSIMELGDTLPYISFNIVD